jgi:UMP-CMP kinase
MSVLIGGPGAGKGTQCEKLAAELDFCHLSAGELLRQEMSANTETGKSIAKHISDGKIVPVHLSLGLLKKAMDTYPKDQSVFPRATFLIDGFPRNWDNVKGWSEICEANSDLKGVVFFDVPADELRRRVLSRASDSGRYDDNEKDFQKRYEIYQTITLPIVEYYSNQSLLIHIDGSKSRDDVYLEFKSKIIKLLATNGSFKLS